MRMKPLAELAKRYLLTPLNTVRDTTDVSVFQELMQDRCKVLPTRIILCYSYIHTVFNQWHLLEAMIEKLVFVSKKPWVDWKSLNNVVAKAKLRKQLTRSSNFYSATLKDVVLQSGHSKVEMPKTQ